MPYRIKRESSPEAKPHEKRVDNTTSWGNPYYVRGSVNESNMGWLRQTYLAIWGAGFVEFRCETAQETVDRYRDALSLGILIRTVSDAKKHLRGCDLLCDCEGPCHADVLLQVANS